MEIGTAKDHMEKWVGRAVEAWRAGDIHVTDMGTMIEAAADTLSDACGGVEWSVGVSAVEASPAVRITVSFAGMAIVKTVSHEPRGTGPRRPLLVSPSVVADKVSRAARCLGSTTMDYIMGRGHVLPPDRMRRASVVIDEVAQRTGLAPFDVERVLAGMGGQDAAMRAIAAKVGEAGPGSEATVFVDELVRHVSARAKVVF